jgi:hypothetical protein
VIAARLEGAVLLTRLYEGSRTFESAYRVWEFRRLIDRGRGASGLVQFWGERKRRVQDSEGNWSRWEVPEHRDPDDLCTVDVGDIVSVTDPKR